MRRLRDAGIVAFLLLGMTGCAGVQHRLGWTEPPYLGDEEDQDQGHPLSRLAFWHRHRADETSPATSRGGTGPGRQVIAGQVDGDGEADDDRPGLLRRMPLVGRIFRHEDRDAPEVIEYPSARPAPASAGTVAAAVPSAPAPAPTAARPAAPAIADTIRVASQPARELSVDLAGTKPEVDAAAVPVANKDADVPPPLNPMQAAVAPRQDSTPPPPAVPTLPAPGAAPANPPQAPPDLTPTTPSTNRGPALPSATIGPEPETAPGPKASAEPWTPPSVTSTPGPVWPSPETSSFVSSDQGIVTTSPQSSAIAAGCDSGCGGKCTTHKLCPLKKHKRKAAYTTVLPSSQSAVSGCDAPCKVKKPCFLKTWLHHKSGCKSKECKGCKTCTYCGETPAMVSEQGLASSQY